MSLVWGTITSVSPFQVEIDGTSTSTPSLNASVATTPTNGYRCLSESTKGIVVVLVVLHWTGSAWQIQRN